MFAHAQYVASFVHFSSHSIIIYAQCWNHAHVLLAAGVGTKIDPTLCRADRMVGHVLGAVGALPDIYIELEISYFLLRRLLGVRMEGDKKGAKVGIGSCRRFRLQWLHMSTYTLLQRRRIKKKLA